MIDTAEIDAEVCGFVRDAAARVTGGNAAFVDDDVRMLECLATRAVQAGLTGDLHPSVAKAASALHPGEQHDMADAPRDGTRILSWVQPEPFEIPNSRGRPSGQWVTPAPHFALVRWWPQETQPGQGHWSTHPKGQGRLRAELLAWWPLPARRAS